MKSAETPPEFPPETFRWMSWSAIKFINRPSLRALAWISYGLLALMAAAFASTLFITLDARIESDGEIVAYPGPLEVTARANGRMGAPKFAVGAHVGEGEVIGHLTSEDEPGSLKPGSERLLLRSPSAGTLIQYDVDPGARLTAGQAVATILPEGSSLVARLPMHAEDLPSLAIGQPVRLRIDAFPSQRYGHFAGEVLALDGSKQENGEFAYKVKASVRPPTDLPPRLRGDVRLVIGMKLHGQIITGHRRLFDIIADDLFGQK